jgi:hypothetical protein
MESNNCICVNNYIDVLKNLINTILSSTGYNQGTNSPATDSGYTTINNNNINTSTNTGGFDYLSTGFYTVMILLGLLMFMIGSRRPKRNSECK